MTPSLLPTFFFSFSMNLTHRIATAPSVFPNDPLRLSFAGQVPPWNQLNFHISLVLEPRREPSSWFNLWKFLTTQHCLLGMHFYSERCHLGSSRLHLQTHKIFCNHPQLLISLRLRIPLQQVSRTPLTLQGDQLEMRRWNLCANAPWRHWWD